MSIKQHFKDFVWGEVIIILVILSIMIIASIFINKDTVLSNISKLKDSKVETTKYVIGCSSNSMGWELYCNNTVNARELNITSTDELIVGRIYVYEDTLSPANLTSHRYLGSVNSSIAVFKGDYNLNIELVSVDRIKSIVESITFE